MAQLLSVYPSALHPVPPCTDASATHQRKHPSLSVCRSPGHPGLNQGPIQAQPTRKASIAGPITGTQYIQTPNRRFPNRTQQLLAAHLESVSTMSFMLPLLVGFSLKPQVPSRTCVQKCNPTHTSQWTCHTEDVRTDRRVVQRFYPYC
jgi:hypothetical protein